MASSADIETALVNAMAAALYPANATGFAGQVSIARGWPTEADIRLAVGNGVSLIGIYAVAGMARDITTSLRRWQTSSLGYGAQEVSRIEQSFRLDLWAVSPTIRDALLGLLEPALKAQPRYPMPDGSTATLMKLMPGGPNDRPSRADEWAQSLELIFHYPIILTQPQPVMTNAILNELPPTIL